MTKNKKILKYNELLEADAKIALELQGLQTKRETLQKEQSDLVIKNIERLEAVGCSVFRKCFPDRTAVALDQQRKILGDQAWIFETVRFKSATMSQLTLSQIKWVHRTTSPQGSWVEASTVVIPRELLHMSDRDFAKLIRQKARAFKKLQKDEVEAKLNAEVRAAERAAKLAAKKLEELKSTKAKLAGVS